MIGFENGGHGMSYPVIDGVIVHDKDVQKVMEMHDKMEKDRIIREAKKRKNEARVLWRTLIKKVCVKRYISKLFDRDPEDRVNDVPMKFNS